MAHVKAEKLWSEAVRKAVHGYHEIEDENGKTRRIRWINKLAQTLVETADAGDMQAMKQVGERLDGKPHQSSDTRIAGDLNITMVKRKIVDPKD